jgi:hypothetical protein
MMRMIFLEQVVGLRVQEEEEKNLRILMITLLKFNQNKALRQLDVALILVKDYHNLLLKKRKYLVT